MTKKRNIKNDSEFRLYPLILEKLKDLGWNTKTISRGGSVYTQTELRNNEELKFALDGKVPENIVKINEKEYWVIEAKSDPGHLNKAIQDAENYAERINQKSELNCCIITGISGSPDSTYYVETKHKFNNSWITLLINDQKATGFISPEQMDQLLTHGKLIEYEIDDDLFNKRTENINKIFHEGSINKRNRAGALSCILLALANEPNFKLSNTSSILINDINSRAELMLKKYKKGDYFDQIKISLPSEDNHEKLKKSFHQVISRLRDLNITSAIESGRDLLGQFYEKFLKYGNDAKELGIVLTPRHITRWASQMLSIQKDDIVFDPACGTGGFLVSALDIVKKNSGGG